MSERAWVRTLSFVFAVGMMVASILTIRHFFMANYPTSIYQGSFCDLNAFFNCDSSAFSRISQIGGVPLGYFGFIVGALVALGAVFPSAGFERTNRSIALFNFIGVVSLFLFSVLYLGSLCLLCSGYYVFSIASFVLYVRYSREPWLRPAPRYAATFAVCTVIGAWGVLLFHEAKKDAQSGVTAGIVKQYFNLPIVKSPSLISPFRSVSSSERFEDAPIQVIEYADFLCPDCLYLSQQLAKLKGEFRGKLNIAFQFFPLEARCNDVVDKDKHPGACELSYIAASNPTHFAEIHDEIFGNFEAARKPEWRAALAKKYSAAQAGQDPATRELVRKIIETGREYEKTSEKFPYGIRSTPTIILNNRMIIGTLPYQQLRAIFQALVEEREGRQKFLENWVPTRP